jgi:cytochrome c oxidase subunit 3
VTERKNLDAIGGFVLTLLLGGFFLFLQVMEYNHAPFEISDLVFGSVFYILTGLHGFHVTVGFIFLFICFIRLLLAHFKSDQHLGFLFAIWYWHFVDVV